MLTDRFPQLKALILDMDGVLWRDTEAIGDLPLIFQTIKDLGLQVITATNNSGASPEEYQLKLASFGVKLDPEQIITSATLTVDYLKEHYPLGTKVFVLGSDSLQRLITKAGYIVSNDEERPEGDCVIAGMDRTLTFQKLVDANRLIRNGAKYIATNTDATFPTPEGLIPGAGTVVMAVQTASGTEPYVIGKPKPYAYQAGMRYLGLKPDQIMGVGDRLNTDIAGAQAAGCLTGFVCSGVNSHESAQAWQPPIDIIADDLWSLLNA